MINMSSLYQHADYPATLAAFYQQSPKKWSVFQSVHLDVAKNRCPICECRLDGSTNREGNHGTLVLKPTIDHYRPKGRALYPFLKYQDKNYILMCADCNNAYKGCLFPLYGNATRATTIEDLDTEQPLIVNPILDDLLALFTVTFEYAQSGRKVLALKPKHSEGYLHHKAKETIKVFCLGDCDTNVHDSENVHNGRIDLLNDHFKKFEGFVTALANKKLKKAEAEYRRYKLDEYGFTQFILNKQFTDLTKVE